MTNFDSIINDIRNIKIQGAKNIALASIKAINLVLNSYKTNSEKLLLLKLNQAKNILINTRPTEPAMRNVLNYIFDNLNSEKDLIEVISKKINFTNSHFTNSDKIISNIGYRKIKSGDNVFTHCHSSTVINILKKAKEYNKKYNVYNTETRPLFQGRKTAKELARLKIPVTHFVDSSARLALKDCDIMLLGADSISSEGRVINKIGSELFAEVADKYDIPVYICSDSWKFDSKSIFGFEEKIEKRLTKEVWPTAPEGVKIDNRVFEIIDSQIITGIISELGIYNPYVFVEEVKKSYPTMF